MLAEVVIYEFLKDIFTFVVINICNVLCLFWMSGNYAQRMNFCYLRLMCPSLRVLAVLHKMRTSNYVKIFRIS